VGSGAGGSFEEKYPLFNQRIVNESSIFILSLVTVLTAVSQFQKSKFLLLKFYKRQIENEDYDRAIFEVFTAFILRIQILWVVTLHRRIFLVFLNP